MHIYFIRNYVPTCCFYMYVMPSLYSKQRGLKLNGFYKTILKRLTAHKQQSAQRTAQVIPVVIHLCIYNFAD